ncbi:hypothetical protein NLM24_14390 [Nocardia zapadnayensis]|uniref:hypothetical protein n=1 Tax=Nocardia rhamnosiphila TaxID=426716 RepID=UPI0022473A04|nr:hypothetical protein [Nocardia zapadnayensis]MCX0271873.1 hypothetical protein [Nocardia zapadnayensis]
MASPRNDHPRRPRRRFRRISLPAFTGAALFGLVITAVPAPTSEAVGIDGSVTAPAGLAVVDLTSGDAVVDSVAAIPRDFADRIGYQPVVRQGVLVAPDGSCSSPVELPPEFDTACMAHDLGYDLLRYADRTGAPLGPWARQALDRTLSVRLHQACETHTEPVVRTRCETLAGIAATAVELNSRRQHYGVPVVETLSQVAAQAATDHPTRPWLLRAVALGLATMAALVFGIRRLHRRIRRTTAPGVRIPVGAVRPGRATGLPRPAFTRLLLPYARWLPGFAPPPAAAPPDPAFPAGVQLLPAATPPLARTG